MTQPRQLLLTEQPEGLIDLDGEPFYVIPDVDLLDPFLMSISSDSDHWMFISSAGPLTAGRRDAANALFPYETDDRLHLATGRTGSVTMLRTQDAAGSPVLWEPFGKCPSPQGRRAAAKSVAGDVVVFEEVHRNLGLVFSYRWTTSEPFGFIRTAVLSNIGPTQRLVTIVDGLVNLLPHGITLRQLESRSNLTNAYRRSEIVSVEPNVALHTLEALIVDQAMPAEALRATVSWSVGPDHAAVAVDAQVLDAVRSGRQIVPASLVVGRPGAHLITTDLELEPGATRTWRVVADVAKDHAAIVALRRHLATASDIGAELDESVRDATTALTSRVAAADGLQRTADDRATMHHFANVLFNAMRGGTFVGGYGVNPDDFAEFVRGRNQIVADHHADFLRILPADLTRSDLVRRAEASGDPDLERLAYEYLPLAFSRRHGDPSRPWNEFAIEVRDAAGAPLLHYEGNWRDIFQNWEALCLSFPEYLPDVISAFVNASTPDGFNPYRITREGIDWEVPDPADPWSNIGYWGDHQIVYLLRLLELSRRIDPAAIDALLERPIFTYADVPYRLVPYDEIVDDPRSTIRYDDEAAARSAALSAEMGGDGKLVRGPDGAAHRATLLEKLVVPALSKLSNFVPGGGIWMNTQRPEWNDANNALAGYGLSMVTLYHLRRYLQWLSEVIADAATDTVPMSAEVADWLGTVTGILGRGEDPDHLADSDRQRRVVMDDLGRAFSAYRWQVYTEGFTTQVEVAGAAVRALCEVALPHLDAAIRHNRRPDGLYHSYNLVGFTPDGTGASIEHLDEMLEGQVAVLGSGILDPAECADVIDALYASELYRADQDSFLLYPYRRPLAFLDRNVIPEAAVSGNPLFVELLRRGDPTVVTADIDGGHHFNADFENAGDLAAALDRLAAEDEWRSLVGTHRGAVLDAYEEVFRHHAFTGRSGTMYGYEGLGSIYWHMVSKLLLTVQECLAAARASGASVAVIDRLRSDYHRVRRGLGFNKTATEYGAFPTDPYSHTPADAGAQQPGMSGMVKEEILARPGELGVWVERGELVFDPVLLRLRQFIPSAQTWSAIDIDETALHIDLEPDSLALTICQVPVIVTLTDGPPEIEVLDRDSSSRRIDGLRLDRATSRAVFGRSGRVLRIHARLPRTEVTLE